MGSLHTSVRADAFQIAFLKVPVSATFWEIAVIVTTSDTNFAAGHFLALEAMMIREARAANRVRLVNGTLPADTAGALGEADRADIESFFEQVKQVMPVLGLDLLRAQPRLAPLSPVGMPNGPNISPAIPRATEFIIQRKEGMIAKARDIDGELVVLEGSEALKDTDFAVNSYARFRGKLLEEGVLREEEGRPFLVFTRDTPFPSPSAAAAVVLNRNSNGRTEWKVNGTGQTYNDWQGI